MTHDYGSDPVEPCVDMIGVRVVGKRLATWWRKREVDAEPDRETGFGLNVEWGLLSVRARSGTG